jgi:hypothetical protein
VGRPDQRESGAQRRQEGESQPHVPTLVAPAANTMTPCST